MSLNSQSQRRLLLTFILSIAACGLLGVYVLLSGQSGRLEESILFSVAIVGASSILGLCCAIAWERRRWHPLGPIAAAAVACATIIAIYSLWQFYFRWNANVALPEIPWKFTFSAWVLAVAGAIASLLSLANLDRRYQWIRKGTVLCLALLALLFFVVIWMQLPRWDSELLSRGMGALGIGVSCGTLAVPIFHRITTIKRREAVRTTELSLTITCPRCNLAQSLPVGRSACAKCKLRFTIDIEEDNCPQCGYALYKLESASCPECGMRVTGTKVASAAE